jgi:superfamily II DNA or RNA helicase
MELPDYASERAYLTKHEERLQEIADIITRKRDEYGNTLVLVNSIPQGRQLQEFLPEAVFLSGSDGKDFRKENYNQYASQDDIIVIATMGIASTGISIDRIFCEIFVDIGKSFVKCIQAVGRGLRKKGDKNKVHVVDIYSKLRYSKKHFKERLKHYKEAQYPILPTKKVKYV